MQTVDSQQKHRKLDTNRYRIKILKTPTRNTLRIGQKYFNSHPSKLLYQLWWNAATVDKSRPGGKRRVKKIRGNFSSGNRIGVISIATGVHYHSFPFPFPSWSLNSILCTERKRHTRDVITHSLARSRWLANELIDRLSMHWTDQHFKNVKVADTRLPSVGSGADPGSWQSACRWCES